MENWKEGARRGGGVGQLWHWRENTPDTRRQPRPGSRHGGAWGKPPPTSHPHSRAPHRVVELGDGRHDGVVVLAPVHLRAASPQLIPPVRGAHGRSGALEQLLLQPRRGQGCGFQANGGSPSSAGFMHNATAAGCGASSAGLPALRSAYWT